MKHADVDILKFLFQKGADVTIKDKTGNIPLHELVKSAEIDSKRSINLIRESAKHKHIEDLLDLKNDEGQTVLYVASKQGNVDIVEFLLTEGANLTERDSAGNSALYQLVCSIESNSDKCVDLVNSLDDEYVKKAIQGESESTKKDGETMLHVIAANGLTGLVQKFDFVDFKQIDNNKDTALHTAARHKHFNTMKEIISVFEQKTGNRKIA